MAAAAFLGTLEYIPQTDLLMQEVVIVLEHPGASLCLRHGRAPMLEKP